MSAPSQPTSSADFSAAADGRELTLRSLLAFYLPLVLTSQMMTLSVPLINLALSRATDPQLHLAAYGVCFGVTVFLNAPMLVSRDVGAGIAVDRERWRQLVRLTLGLGAVISCIDLLLAFSPVGFWVFHDILEATPRVAREAQHVAFAFSPIPILVGMRGLYSALALRAQKTRLLTQATFLRLLVLSAIVFWITQAGSPTAGQVGWSLAAGIALETAWIGIVTQRLLGDLPLRSERGGNFDLRRMVGFATPLVMSAFAWTALRPLINGVLGRTGDSEAAQASFGVLHPLLLLTASALWALQATHQILATDDARARRSFSFGMVMTLLFSSLVFLIGWVPPLREALLTRVFTLPPNLLDYVMPAMRFLWIAPVLLGMRACFKGMILASGRTAIISVTAVADLLAVGTVGLGTLWLVPNVNGALLGVLLVATAELTESSILGRAALHRFHLRNPRRATKKEA